MPAQVDEVKEFVESKKDEIKQKWEETSKEVISSFLKVQKTKVVA